MIGAIVVTLAVFALGMFAGREMPFDILCPRNPQLAMVRTDLAADTVYIKKGTIVSLRQCEYADRFEIDFYLPGKTAIDIFEKYSPKTTAEKEEYSKLGISLAQYSVGISTDEDIERILKEKGAP